MLGWLLKLACRHSWETVAEQTLPSPYEQMEKAGQTLVSMKGLGTALFRKAHVLVLKCPKCGELVRHVTYNPDEWS